MITEKWTWQKAESTMDQRLRNWGLAMRGGIAGSAPPETEYSDPDLLDADIIETAMVACQAERKSLYKVLKYLYWRGRSIPEASNYFKRPEEWVAVVNLDGVRWIINYLRR